MNVTFIQTADAFKYSKMLSHSSLSVIAYAKHHGFQYESYTGLKRGAHPWHASFNRVFMLKEMLERGTRGWVCYMDADAWVADIDFDLVAYLADHTEAAAIFAPSGATELWWDVNNGVFLLNLDHPYSREIVERWMAAMDFYWPQLAEMDNFPPGGPDDQSMMQRILAEGGRSDIVHIASRSVINSESAQFIRQHLRAYQSDFAERVAFIENRVNEVLGVEPATAATVKDHAAWDVVEGLYHGLLERSADGGVDNGYYRTILKMGLREGIDISARNIIGSEEFRSRL